jgi:hypothetical protein
LKAQEGCGLSRYNRIGLSLWCLIATPPLALLLTLLWFTLTHQPQHVNTGDALLDAYLQAAVDCGLLDQERGIRELYTEPLCQISLSHDQWQELERRFGSEPRFWLLCSQFAVAQDEYLSPVAKVKVDSGVRYLEKARDHGCADWVILLQLLLAYDEGWLNEAQERLGLGQPPMGKKATPERMRAYWRRIQQDVDVWHGPELARLLDELQAAGADQALMHYELARIECARGEYAKAAAEIRAGNTVPHAQWSTGCPYEDIARAAVNGQVLGGDKLLTGAVAQLTGQSFFADNSRLKDTVRILADRAAQQHDLMALHDLHDMGCRLGAMSGGSLRQTIVALTVVNAAGKALALADPHPTPVARQARADAAKLRDKLRDVFKTTAINSPITVFFAQSGFCLFPPSMSLRNLVSRAMGGMWTLPTNNGVWCDSLLYEQQVLATDVANYFAQLERLQLWD